MALDWITAMLAAPDRAEYEPYVPTQEQASFVLGFYELDPVTCRRKIRRGVLSRARGWGKSPFVAALAAIEGLGPVVPDGWDADGQPVGKPWCEVRTPLIQIAAVSEQQTKNSWAPLLEMLRGGPVMDEYPGLEPMDTFVNLPRGQIEKLTSSAQTVKGNRAVFAVCDQTEEWVRGNGGHRLSEVMLDNSTKVGGSTIETPNAYTPGMDSVAERTAVAWQKMTSGEYVLTEGLLYDHREAPPETDLSDRDSLMAGLAYVYGDSAECAGGWVDLDRVLARIWEPDMPPQLARSDFLNQVTHASDAWLSQPEWAACRAIGEDGSDPDPVLAGELVTLGFDGSRRRSRGVTDATALIGCRIRDGRLFQIRVWEQPDLTTEEWHIPTAEVDREVRDAFERYSVAGFYADPALWESFVASWEAKYGAGLKVKSSRQNPIEWWMTGGRALHTVRALAQFHAAVVDRELGHCGSATLTRHVLNARRREKTGGMQIAKDFPDSPRKIDAAVAAVLAYAARLDALAAGVKPAARRYVPKRIM